MKKIILIILATASSLAFADGAASCNGDYLKEPLMLHLILNPVLRNKVLSYLIHIFK